MTELTKAVRWQWCEDPRDHEEHVTNAGLAAGQWIGFTHVAPAWPSGRFTIVLVACHGRPVWTEGGDADAGQ